MSIQHQDEIYPSPNMNIVIILSQRPNASLSLAGTQTVLGIASFNSMRVDDFFSIRKLDISSYHAWGGVGIHEKRLVREQSNKNPTPASATTRSNIKPLSSC